MYSIRITKGCISLYAFCTPLLCFSGSHFYALCRGGHYEPAPSLTNKYYCTSWCSGYGLLFGLAASGAWIGWVKSLQNVTSVLIKAVVAELAVIMVHIKFSTWLWATMQWLYLPEGSKIPRDHGVLLLASRGFASHDSVVWSTEKNCLHQASWLVDAPVKDWPGYTCCWAPPSISPSFPFPWHFGGISDHTLSAMASGILTAFSSCGQVGKEILGQCLLVPCQPLLRWLLKPGTEWNGTGRNAL